MLTKLRSRLTYANVVSSIALFLALGGGAAYAGGMMISSEDVEDESLLGQDIRNGSLTRDDLGVLAASERQKTTNRCGTAEAYSDCVAVKINVPRPQRLLVMASGEWESAANNSAEGQCVIQVDDRGARGHRRFGEVATAPSSPFNLSLNSVTDVVPAGEHRVDLSCRKIAGTLQPVRNADLSVAAVGDGS